MIVIPAYIIHWDKLPTYMGGACRGCLWHAVVREQDNEGGIGPLTCIRCFYTVYKTGKVTRGQRDPWLVVITGVG